MKTLFLLLLFLLPCRVWAIDTIAHDSDATSGTVGNVSSFSWNHTIVSNTHGAALIVVYIDTSWNNPNISDVTFGGHEASLVKTVVAGSFYTTWVYSVTGYSTGVNSVVITLTTGTGHTTVAWGGSVAFTGVSQNFPIDTTPSTGTTTNAVTTTGSGTTPRSQNVTTVADNAWIVDALGYHTGGNVWTKDASQTLSGSQFDGTLGEGLGVSYHGPITPPAATADSWSTTLATGAVTGLVGFSLRPFGAAEPPAPPPQLYVRHTTLCNGATGTTTCTFSSNTAGNTILFFANGVLSTSTIPSVTDSAGNTYVLKAFAGCGHLSGPYDAQAVFEADNIAASAGTNTITFHSAAISYDGAGLEYTGLANPAFDQFLCGWNPTATTVTSGIAAQTAVSSEILIDNFATDDTFVTPSDGSTIRFATNGSRKDTWSDLPVSSVGKYAATATVAATPNVYAGIATFKVAGSTPPASPMLGGPLSSQYVPVIDTNPADYPASVWVTDTMQKIRQDSSTAGPNKWITVMGTQNEFVDFQVHFKDSGSGTAGLKVTVSNFVQSAPNSSTINCATLGQCIVYREAYMNVTLPSSVGMTFYNQLGYYPDILIPAVDPYWGQTTNAFPFTVVANKTQSAWVDVHIPANAPSGYYSGTVTVQTGCPGSCVTLTTLPVTLGVWQWPSAGSMPATTTLKTEETGWSFAGMCIQMYSGNGSSATLTCGAYPDGGGTTDGAIAQIWEDGDLIMKDHRFDSGYTSSSYPGSGSFTAYNALAGPNMNGTCRHGGTVCPLLTGSRQTTKTFGLTAGQTWDAPTYTAWQNNFVSQGWGTAGNTPLFDYLRDEPGSGADWTYVTTNGPLRHALISPGPSLPELVTTDIATATTNSALNSIDIMVPELLIFEPLGGASTRANYNTWLAGNCCGFGFSPTRQLWSYIDCLQGGTCVNGSVGAQQSQPNYDVDGLPAAHRAMEWITYLHNQTGELYYAADYCTDPTGGGPLCGYPSAPEDPWVSNYAFGNWGDGTLVYAGCNVIGQNCYMGSGVTTPVILPSVRLKHMRDGVQDYEYLYKLNSLGYTSFLSTQISNWLTNSYTFDVTGNGLQTARTAIGGQLHALTFPQAIGGSAVASGIKVASGAKIQ